MNNKIKPCTATEATGLIRKMVFLELGLKDQENDLFKGWGSKMASNYVIVMERITEVTEPFLEANVYSIPASVMRDEAGNEIVVPVISRSITV